jgi:chromosome segregation ATPase
MDLETNKADVDSGISSVEVAIAGLRLEFDDYLAGDIDEAIELIADLRSQLGDKDVKIEELEENLSELQTKFDELESENYRLERNAE